MRTVSCFVMPSLRTNLNRSDCDGANTILRLNTQRVDLVRE